MFNIKLIFKILGALLNIEAAFMLLCLIVSLCRQENDMLPLAVTVGVTVSVALLFRFLGRGAANSLSRRDAYLLVTTVWIAFAAFGSLPFLLGGYINNVSDAFFEAMSGLTTTGATTIDHVEGMPHGVLLWRSLTQWIGGLGIVFFTIAILPSFVGGSVKIFAAEATGPVQSKLQPRLTTSAKALWGIYLVLTAGCALCFYIFGMGVFDAVNYAMTITATGGFATHDASTGYFNNPAIDYTAIIFMFLSGVSFAMLYAALFKGKIKSLFKNAEFRFYSLLTLAATTIIVAFLLRYNDYSVSHSISKSELLDHVNSIADINKVYADEYIRLSDVVNDMEDRFFEKNSEQINTFKGNKEEYDILSYKICMYDMSKQILDAIGIKDVS